MGEFRVARVSGAVTCVGDLIASEGGNIAIVRGGISGPGDLGAFLRGRPACFGPLATTLLAAVVCSTTAAIGQVAVRCGLILVRCDLVAIGCRLISRGARLLAIGTNLVVVRTVLVAIRGCLFEVRKRPVAFRFTCCGHFVSLSSAVRAAYGGLLSARWSMSCLSPARRTR